MKNNFLSFSIFSALKFSLFVYLSLFLLPSCQEPNSTNNNSTTATKSKKKKNKVSIDIIPPSFSSDSAYSYIEKQINFGPRVPNTRPHTNCGNWIVKFLKDKGLKIQEQTFQAETYNGESLYLRNIIGSYKPEKKKRILLMAHWDTRPIADKDSLRVDQPIDGANDGASGVGVLLEMARVISLDNQLDLGIDFLFFDGEDYGAPNKYTEKVSIPYNGYCLGSHYWANNKHIPNYSAFYGILLDMVGRKDAQFALDAVSREFAPSILNKVWGIAEKKGKSNVFISKNAPSLIDDHVPVNKIAKIPTIDIIEYNPEDGYFFGKYHHTHQDNIDLISKETLLHIGEVLLILLYNQK